MKGRTRIARWIFCAFSVLYIATTRGHFVGTDEVTMYQTTRSLWEEGSLATNARLPNSLPARGGGTVGSYTPAQSIAAVPFYVAGKIVGAMLRRAGREDWARTLGGPVIESGGADYRWGGDVEMFFVGLFNAFVTALLVSLFFVGGYQGLWRSFGMMDAVVFARGVIFGTIASVALMPDA